ncbi:hypothetical protein QYE76_025511 [Lolium multiflorum]|uniref:Uncharacterized protein n=1 Tax=Lolium multiflorum TaxID=4521 RepID=A0AAD8RI17_LOLMU|nr:hypothetical protein QYE76_025511 [Lolium multiflorum]
MAQRPVTIPESDQITALSFLKLVRVQLASSSPAVYEEFLSLLLSFGVGTGPSPDAVKDRAYALLRGHPDLVRGLAVFLPGEDAPGPAREDPAPTRPRRERCPTPAVVDDVRRFLRQVKSRKPEAYDSLLELIFDAGHAKDLNQIYRRALEIFGHPRSYFLSEFVKYLPLPTELERASLPRRRATTEPRPEEHRAHAPKRKEPWPEEHRAHAPKRKEPWPEEHRAQAPKRKAAATVVAADCPGAAKRARSEDRRTTTTSRRANSPAVADAAAKTPFRESWEFETTYTKLVATVTRTEELLEQYEKPETAPPPRGRREFDELFPDPECLEVLREMYQDMFDRIRAALEDGARTELALKTVRRRLEMLEQLAVRRAMECRDPARVEGRMHKLAVDRVKVLLKRRAKKAARIRELAS